MSTILPPCIPATVANILENVTFALSLLDIVCLFVFIVADIISTVEFNYDGELLATGDKGGRIVIFQKEDAVSSG